MDIVKTSKDLHEAKLVYRERKVIDIITEQGLERFNAWGYGLCKVLAHIISDQNYDELKNIIDAIVTESGDGVYYKGVVPYSSYTYTSETYAELHINTRLELIDKIEKVLIERYPEYCLLSEERINAVHITRYYSHNQQKVNFYNA